MDHRRLDLRVVEATRACSHCQKSLVGIDDILLVALPMRGAFFEFCGIKCLFKYLLSRITITIQDNKLRDSNLLSNMGYEEKTVDARLHEYEEELSNEQE